MKKETENGAEQSAPRERRNKMTEYVIEFENGKVIWYEGTYMDALRYAETMELYGDFTIEEGEE